MYSRQLSAPEPRFIDRCFFAGSSFDGYKFVCTLGQGTFGKVKLAEDKQTGKKVAIKIIDKKSVRNDRQQASVTRELRLLFLLRHPNVIGVHELIETVDNVAIVMEYAPRGELFSYIVKCGRLEEDVAKGIFIQILHVIHHLHSVFCFFNPRTA